MCSSHAGDRTMLVPPEIEAADAAENSRWVCATCGEQLSSGTQLHLHLADTGHAVDRSLLPDAGPPPPPPANADFFGYYSAQRICASAADWAAAYAKFAEPLPRDFRLSAHSHERAAAVALGLLRTQEGTGLAPAGGAATVPGTAWRVGRRDEATKRLMLAAQDCGLLHRQELVSQLPAAVLGVRPEHAVLDMCCAPGSKVGKTTRPFPLESRLGHAPCAKSFGFDHGVRWLCRGISARARPAWFCLRCPARRPCSCST